MKASDLFTLPASLARFATFFPADALPWQWLKAIGPALAAAGEPDPLPPLPPGLHVEGRVWLHPSVKLPPFGVIIGPAYIGARTELRPGVFIRGNVIVGEGCVLGNSCEFKNCLLMDGVQAPHFNYVGDSILGNRSHLGAGVICSNLRLDQAEVKVKVPTGVFDTGLRKFGALLGDQAEVGCNAVLNPGAILGPRAIVMPCVPFGGYLPGGTLARTRNSVIQSPRRD